MNQAWFWLGLTFMFIPSLFLGLLGPMLKKEIGGSRREGAVRCAVITPLYPLYVITMSIDTEVNRLQGRWTEKWTKATKWIKQIEIMGE